MRRVPLRLAIALPAIVLSLFLSRAAAENDLDASPEPRRQAAFVETMANAEDLFLGGSVARLVAARPGLSVGASFAMRPYRRWVREPIGPHLLLQVHERRYAFALELSDQFSVHPILDLYSKVGAGRVFADFEGTRRDPDEGWFAIADAGLALNFFTFDRHRWSLRIGYRYADLRSDHRGWMHAALGSTF